MRSHPLALRGVALAAVIAVPPVLSGCGVLERQPEPLSAEAFLAVCEGTPAVGAATFDSQRPGEHRMVLFQTAGSDDLQMVAAGQSTILNPVDFAREPETVELVGCAERTAVDEADPVVCTGYQTIAGEPAEDVRMAAAEYEVVVRAAATGEELERFVHTARNEEDCPIQDNGTVTYISTDTVGLGERLDRWVVETS